MLSFPRSRVVNAYLSKSLNPYEFQRRALELEKNPAVAGFFVGEI
jgi:hypothetical protein